MERSMIIKALECCSEIGCGECPYFGHIPCTGPMKKNALALIKELTEDNEAQAETIKSLIETIKDVKADTVREMQERLKYTLCINNEENTEFFDYSYTLETINEVANEILNKNTEEEKK